MSYTREGFESRLCNLTTQAYLLNDDNHKPISDLISRHAADEIERVQNSLSRQATKRVGSKEPRVVLCNYGMDGYAGSELWTSDVAKYLKSQGISAIVYTGVIGLVAKSLAEAGVEVTSSLERVERFEPNLLHINHFEAARPVIDRMNARVPIINMVHGLLPRPGLPGYEGVKQYCCVSIASKAKIHLLAGTEWEKIETVPNFFDEQRFTGIGDASSVRRAVLLSSRTSPEHREQLRATLDALGIELDHIGYGGRPTANPEQWLSSYDLVFAVGRSAIEGLASGAHVILWDAGIIGPGVTRDNFWRCVTDNFSLPANLLYWTFVDYPDAQAWITKEVTAISADGRRQTTSCTRSYLPLCSLGAKLVEVFDKTLQT